MYKSPIQTQVAQKPDVITYDRFSIAKVANSQTELNNRHTNNDVEALVDNT